MYKLLAGVFIGVFAGVFTYEILKRVKPDWAGVLQDGVEKTVNGLEGIVGGPLTGKKPGKRRAK